MPKVMPRQHSDLFKLAATIIGIFVLISLSGSVNEHGFHVHDTFYVMDATAKFILIFVFSIFAGSLILNIVTLFRRKFYIKILAFTAFLLLCSGIYIMSVFM